MASSRIMFLAYISRIACSREEIDNIVNRSAENNATCGVTGALIHDATHFIQFLEGPAGATGDTILRIISDRRHDEVRILTCEPTEARLFSSWHMKHVAVQIRDAALINKIEKIATAPKSSRSLMLQHFALELSV